MFNPGDWVKVKPSKRLPTPAVGRVSRVRAGSVWVEIDFGSENLIILSSACRKLTEHEIMEALTDV
jgi:hypothetical protein